VVVEANIDDRGNVTEAKAIAGPILLRQAALESVKHWKYAPATLDGKPTSSEVKVSVEFRLK
jgi:protein TonB